MFIRFSRLFWTDWDRKRPRIERMSLDGSGRSVLVETDIQRPNSLAIDRDSSQLCWTDAGDSHTSFLPRIGKNIIELSKFIITIYSFHPSPFSDCIDFDGRHRKTLLMLDSNDQPYGLTLTGSSVYWTDWKK